MASLVFCAGLITVTYAATSWFTTHPATIASWNFTWSSQHYAAYRNHYQHIATYLIRENGDSASNCLLIGPLLGLVFGVVGATLGRRVSRGDSGGRPSHRRRGAGWLHWLATAGGLGAWRVYPYGLVLAVELAFVPAIGPDNFDGGALTPFLGLACADVGLSLGRGTPATPDRVAAILFSMPVSSLCTTLGLLCGAVGGALARPQQVLRAFSEAQERGPI